MLLEKQTHPDYTRQQVMKRDNKFNTSGVNKTGKQSNSAIILIIHAPVHAGEPSFRKTSMRAASRINICTTDTKAIDFEPVDLYFRKTDFN